MSEQTINGSAAGSGTISLGSELTVNRPWLRGHASYGEGVWGPPNDPATAIASFGAPSSWESTSSIRLIPMVRMSAKS